MIRVILISLASIAIIGAIGYGTVVILRQVKAPTLSGVTQSESSPTVPQQPVTTPEDAQKIADDAYESGRKKAEAGDQKAALADYKKAYENYKLAQNTPRADDAAFIIKSIEAVLAVPKNSTPPRLKAAAKE
jgi:hypothetical protein